MSTKSKGKQANISSPSDRKTDQQFPPDKGGKGGYIPYNKNLTEYVRRNKFNADCCEAQSRRSTIMNTKSKGKQGDMSSSSKRKTDQQFHPDKGGKDCFEAQSPPSTIMSTKSKGKQGNMSSSSKRKTDQQFHPDKGSTDCFEAQSRRSTIMNTKSKGKQANISSLSEGKADRQFHPDKGGKGGYIPYNKTLTEYVRRNKFNADCFEAQSRRSTIMNTKSKGKQANISSLSEGKADQQFHPDKGSTDCFEAQSPPSSIMNTESKGKQGDMSSSPKRKTDRQFPPDKGGKGGYIPYNKTLTEKARKNRKNLTPAEQKLWYEVLQSKRLDNLKFTRQKPLDEYIVDFYCAKLMLAIEIDGDTHAGQKQYDEDRTKNLNKFGVEVIRYTNAEVLNNLEGVYQDLHKRISARKPPKSPLSGGLDD